LSVPDHDPAAEHPALSVGLAAVATDVTVWILVLAAFFDGVSDNWVHAILLTAVSVLVARDAVLAVRGVDAPESVALLPGSGHLTRRQGLGLLLVAVAYSAVAGAWGRYTWPDTFAILVPGVAVLMVGWRGSLRPVPVPDAPSRRGVRTWSLVLVALGLWELFALLAQPSFTVSSDAHPTVSYLMDPVLASHLGRSLTLLAWLVIGWYVLGQVPGRPREEVADDVA